MKKVVYFLLAWMLVGLSACENEPKFKVQGEVSGAEDKVLYFEASSLNGVVVLDSVRLGSDGNFSFAENRPESPEFYRLRLDGKVVNFAVDSTETVQIKSNAGKFDTEYAIEGSENNKKIKELALLQAELQHKVDLLSQNTSMPAGIKQDNLLLLVKNYKDNVKRNYIFKAPNATYALNFAIKGCVEKDTKVLISGFEHNSVIRPLYATGADIVEGNFNVGSTFGFVCGKVIRAELFSHLCFPSGYWFEDTIVAFFLYPLCQRIEYCDGVHYYYRHNSNSIMHSYAGRPKALDSLWVSKRVLSDYFSLGNKATISLYQMFLQDALSTKKHLLTLNDKLVMQSLFVIQCNIAQTYFSDFLLTEIPSSQLKYIHQSFQTSNFRRWMCL